MVPHSGGWSFPVPGKDQESSDSLPPLQLYDLKHDPFEKVNVNETNPGKVTELKRLLISYILEGRSTEGKFQPNDPIDFNWPQTDFVNQ